MKVKLIMLANYLSIQLGAHLCVCGNFCAKNFKLFKSFKHTTWRSYFNMLILAQNNFGFSKNGILQITRRVWAVNLGSLGLDTLSGTETSKLCIIP